MRTDPKTADVSRAIARDDVLDMVKGLLVVGMLIIHASNLFLDDPAAQRLVYPRLLGFVSGSWLWIGGYIVGRRYRNFFQQDPRAITQRLISRGWRLVAIFVVSNVILGNLSVASCFGYEPVGGCNLIQVFLLGDDAQAFEVLLGIGYLLVIAPLCLWLPTGLIAGITLGLVAGLSALEQAGVDLPLLAWMLACGIAGIIIGSLVSPRAIQSVLGNARPRNLFVALALLTWGSTAALFASRAVSIVSPVFYIPHVVSALSLLYVLGAWIARVELLRGPLTLMAKYSLLAYIGQMAILQGWYRVASHWSAAGYFLVSVVVTLLTLLASLHVLASLRNKFGVIDRIYLSVFG